MKIYYSYVELTLDTLNTKYPQKTLHIVKKLIVRQEPKIYNDEAEIITNYLLEYHHNNVDKFIKDELKKDLNPLCFKILYNKSTLKYPELKEHYIIVHLNHILNRNEVEIHWTFTEILKEVKDPLLKHKIWWMCYDYIQLKRDNPILPLLKIMDNYFRDETVKLCLSHLSSGELKKYPTWDMFNLVWCKRDISIDNRLKAYFDNQPYSFKQTDFGLYIHQRLYPELYHKKIQRLIRYRDSKRYPYKLKY